MRIILFLFISLVLYGAGYDPLLIRAQASMFPKIILLDKEIANKTVDGTIAFHIVYSPEEYSQAKEFKKMVETQYKGRLGEFRLNAELISADDISLSHHATAYMLFDISGNKTRALVHSAAKNHRICFAYHYKDFDNNVLISLLVKEKTYIYLNKAALKDYEINFIPVFYKIVKVIE